MGLEGWMDGVGKIDGQIEGWDGMGWDGIGGMDGWMDGWRDGMNGWMNGWGLKGS